MKVRIDHPAPASPAYCDRVEEGREGLRRAIPDLWPSFVVPWLFRRIVPGSDEEMRPETGFPKGKRSSEAAKRKASRGKKLPCQVASNLGRRSGPAKYEEKRHLS